MVAETLSVKLGLHVLKKNSPQLEAHSSMGSKDSIQSNNDHAPISATTAANTSSTERRKLYAITSPSSKKCSGKVFPSDNCDTVVAFYSGEDDTNGQQP